MKTTNKILIAFFIIVVIINIGFVSRNDGSSVFISSLTAEESVIGGNRIPCYKNYDCLGGGILIVFCGSCSGIYVQSPSTLRKCRQWGT